MHTPRRYERKRVTALYTALLLDQPKLICLFLHDLVAAKWLQRQRHLGDPLSNSSLVPLPDQDSLTAFFTAPSDNTPQEGIPLT